MAAVSWRVTEEGPQRVGVGEAAQQLGPAGQRDRADDEAMIGVAFEQGLDQTGHGVDFAHRCGVQPQYGLFDLSNLTQALAPVGAQLVGPGDLPAEIDQGQGRNENDQQTVDCEHDGNEFTRAQAGSAQQSFGMSIQAALIRFALLPMELLGRLPPRARGSAAA